MSNTLKGILFGVAMFFVGMAAENFINGYTSKLYWYCAIANCFTWILMFSGRSRQVEKETDSEPI
jgi:hypothetical protein